MKTTGNSNLAVRTEDFCYLPFTPQRYSFILVLQKTKPMVTFVAIRRKTPGLMFSLWKNKVMYSLPD